MSRSQKLARTTFCKPACLNIHVYKKENLARDIFWRLGGPNVSFVFMIYNYLAFEKPNVKIYVYYKFITF